MNEREIQRWNQVADSIAAKYFGGVWHGLEQGVKTRMQAFYTTIESRLVAADSLLLLGSGSDGYRALSSELRKKLLAKTVAVDFSPKMLQLLQGKVQQTVEADLNTLDFTNLPPAECIVSEFALRYVDDQPLFVQKLLGEMQPDSMAFLIDFRYVDRRTFDPEQIVAELNLQSDQYVIHRISGETQSARGSFLGRWSRGALVCLELRV